MSTQDEAPAPALRIEHGNPTPEELAALVTVLAAVAGDDPAPAAPRSSWAGRARRDWRRSSLPR